MTSASFVRGRSSAGHLARSGGVWPIAAASRRRSGRRDARPPWCGARLLVPRHLYRPGEKCEKRSAWRIVRSRRGLTRPDAAGVNQMLFGGYEVFVLIVVL